MTPSHSPSASRSWSCSVALNTTKRNRRASRSPICGRWSVGTETSGVGEQWAKLSGPDHDPPARDRRRVPSGQAPRCGAEWSLLTERVREPLEALRP